MPVFRYKAVNPAGDVAVGELEAEIGRASCRERVSN